MDSNRTSNSLESVAGFYTPSDEQLELLQSILQGNSNVLVTLDDTREIGVQLVSLYECLSKDKLIAGAQGNEQR